MTQPGDEATDSRQIDLLDVMTRAPAAGFSDPAFATEIRKVEPDRPGEFFVLVDIRGEIHRRWHGLASGGWDPARSIESEMCSAMRNHLAVPDLRRDPWHDVVCVDDGDGPTWRHELWPAYKAHRKPNDELTAALPGIRAALRADRHRVVRVPGREADDVIATLTARAVDAGRRVHIVSSDKDLLQLVDGHSRVRVFDARKAATFDSAMGVFNRVGVKPHLVPTFLALAGDASDGLSGVPGIGPKWAYRLIDAHGPLDDILDAAALGKVEPKRMAKKLTDEADTARTMLRLVTLDRDVELPADVLEWLGRVLGVSP